MMQKNACMMLACAGYELMHSRFFCWFKKLIHVIYRVMQQLNAFLTATQKLLNTVVCIPLSPTKRIKTTTYIYLD